MSENVSSENWQHYSSNATKRKRAELVCFACHSKKIKCDLQQQRNNHGRDSCKNCFAVGRACLVRPSKREKKRKQHVATSTTSGQDDTTISDGIDGLLALSSRDMVNSRNSIQRHPSTVSIHGDPQSAQLLDQIQLNLGESGTPQQRHASTPSVSQGYTGRVSTKIPAQSSRRAASQNTTSPLLQRDGVANSIITETTPTQNGDMDTGFLQVYAQENQFDAENQAFVAQLEHRYCSDLNPDLTSTLVETYFEYCYPWCPVLDRSTLSSDIERSPLLANALALASSHIQPPLLPHNGTEAYYKRARMIFYNDEEADEIMALKALCLFYWWAPQSPSRVHRHSSWWWTSVIIRHCQQMNFHREPGAPGSRVDLSLRRKIWWTVFARERLTSLCQGKPMIIDEDDCRVEMPSLADFPPDPKSQHQGEIFIYWIRLCAIIGRIAKFLLKSNINSNFIQQELREELVVWVHSLPPRLKLPIGTNHTMGFDRDVHQLHLFYLTTIIILHLKRSGGQLPQALPPAILAASCTARILRDILARGNSRFLMAITCWHVGTAFIALLQACRIPHLSKAANDDLDILAIAVKELQKMWASANVVAQGFERLRAPQSAALHDYVGQIDPHNTSAGFAPAAAQHEGHFSDQSSEDFDWMRFFPFVTKSTGGIAESLVNSVELGTATKGFPSPDNEVFYGTLLAQYQDLFDPFTDMLGSGFNFDSSDQQPPQGL